MFEVYNLSVRLINHHIGLGHQIKYSNSRWRGSGHRSKLSTRLQLCTVKVR